MCKFIEIYEYSGSVARVFANRKPRNPNSTSILNGQQPEKWTRKDICQVCPLFAAWLAVPSVFQKNTEEKLQCQRQPVHILSSSAWDQWKIRLSRLLAQIVLFIAVIKFAIKVLSGHTISKLIMRNVIEAPTVSASEKPAVLKSNFEETQHLFNICRSLNTIFLSLLWLILRNRVIFT